VENRRVESSDTEDENGAWSKGRLPWGNKRDDAYQTRAGTHYDIRTKKNQGPTPEKSRRDSTKRKHLTKAEMGETAIVKRNYFHSLVIRCSGQKPRANQGEPAEREKTHEVPGLLIDDKKKTCRMRRGCPQYRPRTWEPNGMKAKGGRQGGRQNKNRSGCRKETGKKKGGKEINIKTRSRKSAKRGKHGKTWGNYG